MYIFPKNKETRCVPEKNYKLEYGKERREGRMRKNNFLKQNCDLQTYQIHEIQKASHNLSLKALTSP